MNLRVKDVRKHFSKTQKAFGESLGVSRDTFASYESGRVEPSKTFVQLLCATYHVSEEWLTAGKGDMFVQTKQSFVEKLSAEYGLSFTAQKIIDCYLNLDDEQRSTVDFFINSIAESITEAPAEKEDKARLTVVDDTIEKTDRIFRVAKSDDNAPAQILDVSHERIRKLEEAPEVTEI